MNAVGRLLQSLSTVNLSEYGKSLLSAQVYAREIANLESLWDQHLSY